MSLTSVKPTRAADPAPRRVPAGRASVITLLGTVLSAVMAFVVTGLVSNRVGAETTGYFFQGVALFSIAATAVTLGTDTAMVRTASRLQALSRADKVWGALASSVTVVVGLSSLVAVLTWIWAPDLAELLGPSGGQEDLTAALRGLAPFLPFSPLLAILLGTSRGLGQTYPYTLVQNTLVPVTRVVLVAVAVSTSVGLGVLLTAWAAPVVLGVVAGAWALWGTSPRSAPTGRSRIRPEGSRELWSFALPHAQPHWWNVGWTGSTCSSCSRSSGPRRVGSMQWSEGWPVWVACWSRRCGS